MPYLRCAVVFGLMMTCRVSGFAQDVRNSDRCNFAKVKPPSQSAFIPVRTGAASRFRRRDTLRDGQEVYICDERGDWYKVFYSGPAGPCRNESGNGLNVEKTKGCRSGWVEKKWIEVISG